MQPIAKLTTMEKFTAYMHSQDIRLPISLDTEDNKITYNQPIRLNSGKMIGNRFCIHPMEGWDGTQDGKPTELTTRRWKNFGRSGAKLIWGGEAVAVRHDGRANPNQLVLTPQTQKEIGQLREALIHAHQESGHSLSGLLIGLQLTHSGRFSRPNDKMKLEPIIAYHHAYLDKKFHILPEQPVITDSELEGLIEDYVKAACLAQQLGYDFVDIKHCHGYLGHELLSAYSRSGNYGGSFKNRTHFLQEIVKGIRRDASGLEIGVRFSLFDLVAFEPDPVNRIGTQVKMYPYPRPFGADPEDSNSVNLDEPRQFMQLLRDLDIQLVNLTAGSPYYNPHIQRPAMFPPSDGYLPPEDPLIGVARQINACAEIKADFKDMVIVGSGYTYLQEWLPYVAAGVLKEQMIDMVGLGRMVLSYPEFPADLMNGNEINRRKLCRTFSDCTTAPRCGLVSGCYPLDHYYKDLPESEMLAQKKKQLAQA